MKFNISKKDLFLLVVGFILLFGIYIYLYIYRFTFSNLGLLVFFFIYIISLFVFRSNFSYYNKDTKLKKIICSIIITFLTLGLFTTFISIIIEGYIREREFFFGPNYTPADAIFLQELGYYLIAVIQIYSVVYATVMGGVFAGIGVTFINIVLYNYLFVSSLSGWPAIPIFIRNHYVDVILSLTISVISIWITNKILKPLVNTYFNLTKFIKVISALSLGIVLSHISLNYLLTLIHNNLIFRIFFCKACSNHFIMPENYVPFLPTIPGNALLTLIFFISIAVPISLIGWLIAYSIGYTKYRHEQNSYVLTLKSSLNLLTRLFVIAFVILFIFTAYPIIYQE